jgi:hypothetical protein
MAVTCDHAIHRLRNNGDTGKGNNPSEERPAGSTLAQGCRHGSRALVGRCAVNDADGRSDVLSGE